ncbi:MAG: hypothetical protein ACXAEN_24060 [Candidatus Thorarchaeota archaeon]|jgi:hypothetical protein
MKLYTTAYNPADGNYLSEIEETKLRSYVLNADFNTTAKCRIVLADVDGSISRKYGLSVIEQRLYDNAIGYNDYTTEANSPSALDNCYLLPGGLNVTDAVFFGLDEKFGGVYVDLRVACVGVFTITYKYWDGAAWSALGGVVDDTTRFTVTGKNVITWTIPGDWATTEVDGSTKYWVKGEVTAVTNYVGTKPNATRIYANNYIGAGKVKLEDPDATTIFQGRIMKTELDTQTRQLVLHCEDWLSQLDEDKEDIDMREDLDSDDDMGEQGLRQSILTPDPDNATYVGPAYTNGANYYLYDDSRSWNADEFNSMYVVFTAGASGINTWATGPYTATVTNGSPPTGDGDHEVLWKDDASTAVVFDAAANFEVQYDYRMYLGHDAVSALYVDDSISNANIILTGKFSATAGQTCYVKVWENSGGGSWVVIGQIENDNTITLQRYTFAVPEQYLLDLVDATGLIKVMFDISWAAGSNSTLELSYCVAEITCRTTPYTSTVAITDVLDLNAHGGKVNCLKVSTDMTAAATRVWDQMPYCIARPITQHIDSDLSPGNFITDKDPLVTLTCAANIEALTAISTRNYQERTRLDVLKDLAKIGKFAFWMPIGGVDLTVKSTFAAAPAGEYALTDASCTWRGGYDYNKVVNEYHIRGIRVGDHQITQDTADISPDPGVDSKKLFGVSRSKGVSNTGVVSDYHAKTLGAALVEREEDGHLMLEAEFTGNIAHATHDHTLKLGDEVSITSTYLGLTAEVYVITNWVYDSTQHKSTIRLHKRTSTKGFLPYYIMGEGITDTQQTDIYAPGLHTQEW